MSGAIHMRRSMSDGSTVRGGEGSARIRMGVRREEEGIRIARSQEE